MSRIVSLQTTNYKRLKAVRIEPDPDGNLVVVGGKNAQGKSSVLDSITAALGGVNAKTTPKPIRDGEERAEIILETEDFVVTRRFTAGGSTLTLKSHDGAVYPKAQAKLDDWLGTLSLDPLAFTQLSDKEQLKALLELVELPFDPQRLEADRAKLFALRTDVNRDLKQMSAQIEQYGEFPEDAPTEEVSVSALLSEYRNVEAEQLRLRRAQQAVDDLNREESELLAKLAEIRRGLAEAENDLIRAQDEMTDRSLDNIQDQIDSAETTNSQVRTFAAYRELVERQARVVEYANDLTAQIGAIDKRKADGLAAAVFPVDDLGFDNSGVTYNGVPFKQASSAEQLRVSLAMAIALNPKLRVIRIADGSLLDSDNLALVESIAREHDFQVWIEMVGDGHENGIVIEDGEVKQ